ncbi:hypothetical protein D3C77_661720 [compost metagenome]
MAPKLVCAHFERYPRPCRRFLENESYGFPLQRLVNFPVLLLALDFDRQIDQILNFFSRIIIELDKIPAAQIKCSLLRSFGLTHVTLPPWMYGQK